MSIDEQESMNTLPLNCVVEYLDDFLSVDEADEIHRCLLDQYRLHEQRLVIEAGGSLVETDSFKILFATDRLIQEGAYPEQVHGKVYEWAGMMEGLRSKVERLLDKEFEVAMCLYYPDGNFFAPFHFDQQTSGEETILPSISLGEVREFCFKGNDGGATYSLDLAHGSLLVMGKHCQSRYEHSLIKNPEYKNGRINITFREPKFK